MWLLVFCWQSLLTLCLTLVIFCHVSELKFLTQWSRLRQHHLEMPGSSSGTKPEGEGYIPVPMCIALLQHAKEKMGEQVWSEQRGDTAGWTCVKNGENYSLSRGWFRVRFSCCCLRMKVIKPIWSSSLWPWRSDEAISLSSLLPGGARKTLGWGLAPLGLSRRGHQQWWWVIEAMAGWPSFLLALFHFASF